MSEEPIEHETTSIEHSRQQLLERLRLADKSESVIGLNLGLLETVVNAGIPEKEPPKTLSGMISSPDGSYVIGVEN